MRAGQAGFTAGPAGVPDQPEARRDLSLGLNQPK